MSDRNDITSKPHAPSDEHRRWLANALATWVQPGDIAECDCCEAYCLEEDVRMQYGSMGKEARLCPECDSQTHAIDNATVSAAVVGVALQRESASHSRMSHNKSSPVNSE